MTEFLPVSSTGHLKIAEGLLGIPVWDAAVVGFTAVIQIGSIAAALVYFFDALRRFVVAWAAAWFIPRPAATGTSGLRGGWCSPRCRSWWPVCCVNR